MKRIFIALPVPSKIGMSLMPMQNGIQGARYSPIENFHITLRFIGDLNEAIISELDAQLGEIKFESFELSLSQIGFFGNENPHSVHVLVDDNQALNLLQEKCDKICKSMGFVKEHKKFIPHVTLAYLSKNVALEEVISFKARNNLFKSKKWRADRFFLYSSYMGQGPSKYIIEAEYPLI